MWWGVTILVIGLGTLYLLRSLLAILLASVAMAYLLDPLVDRFEARGRSREFGIVVLAITATLILVGLLGVVLPSVALEFRELSSNLSGYVSDLGQGLMERKDWIEEQTGLTLPETLDGWLTELQRQLFSPDGASGAHDEAGLAGVLADAAPDVGLYVTNLLKQALAGGVSFILAFVNLALVPIFVFYLLRDWDRMIAAVDGMIPPRHRGRVRRLAGDIDERLASFVRGQITVCCALGVLYSAGLLISGIDLAIGVGMLSGALFIVPYLGTIVGVVLASLLALLKFGLDWHLVACWITFGGVQLVEGSLLTPWIVGDKVGLHPLVVMIALLVGGNLFGIWGMLLAIPVTAAAQVLLLEWFREYQASNFFGGLRAGKRG